MLISERDKLASILQTAADVLDMPDDAYEDATLKYEDVGEHLAEEDSDLRQYNPRIYPQGSFRLGTVVQPYGREGEYDIDLVCELDIPKDNITQQELKNRVGRRLKSRADLAAIVKPSRRCWVLNYSKKTDLPAFHMDVLPSIPNLERRPTGILLTDTELTKWQKSNPVAYADWFRKRMDVIFKVRKLELAESIKTDIADIPDWRVKTPLQRSIQILKRHRDIYFQKKLDDKPASIILTTLAAHAYQNQADVFDALMIIVKGMPSFIESRGGKLWVQNPVDPDENFADKWNDYPERREAFMQWLEKVRIDFTTISKSSSLSDGLFGLDESLGRKTISEAALKLGVKRPGFFPAVERLLALIPGLGDTQHAQAPKWPVAPQYTATISAGIYVMKKNKKKGRFLWPLGENSTSKGVWIKFTVKTDAPEPFSVEWQIVNTGKEAFEAGQPRGDFYEADSENKHIRWESTSYRGTHWVEAFILKNGVCVARSDKRLVKVR